MNNDDSIFPPFPEVKPKEWWAQKRKKYNIGLIFAGIIAFAAFATIITIKSNHDVNNTDPEKYEITIFTIFFQGIGYLFMMFIANLFYYLGPFADKTFNKNNSDEFRNRLFNLGFWFSVALPFSIPILVLLFA